MQKSRVKTTHAYGEVSPNVWDDFAWVRQNRQMLLEQYGECIILVYEKQVVGIGQTIDEAIQDAEQHLSPDVEHITPITEFLRKRRLFHNLNSITKQE